MFYIKFIQKYLGLQNGVLLVLLLDCIPVLLQVLSEKGAFEDVKGALYHIHLSRLTLDKRVVHSFDLVCL